MKTYKVRYLDKDGKEQAGEVEAHSDFDARVTFTRKYAGKFKAILSTLSLGKNAKPSQ